MAGISTWRVDCVLTYLGEVMDIIELAKQAGLDWASGWTLEDDEPNRFETFAALVEAAARADEREECAKVCLSFWNKWLDTSEENRYKVLYDAEDCADAIRERGTT